MDPVERLVAIEEIKRLKARYVRLCDSKQWDAWGEVFTDDCEFRQSDLGTIVGRAEIVARISATMDGSTVYHYINGVNTGSVANSSTNFPNDELLRLTMEFLTGEAVANTCKIRWVRLIQVQ